MQRLVVRLNRDYQHGFGFEMVAIPDDRSNDVDDDSKSTKQVAIVSHVLDGGPAEGHLLPRDRIVSCNEITELPAVRPDECLLHELLRSPIALLTIERTSLMYSQQSSVEVSFAVSRSGSSPRLVTASKPVSGVNGVSINAANTERLLGLLDAAGEVTIDFSRKTGPARTLRLRSGLDGSLGFRLIGGNVSGVFITDVLPDKAAALAGIQVGDRLLAVDGIDLTAGATKEMALLALMSSGNSNDGIRVTLAPDKVGFDRLMSGEVPSDLFHVLARIDLPSLAARNELNVRAGDIFQIVNSVATGLVGVWEAVRVHPPELKSGKSTQGRIPSAGRAVQLAMSQGLRPPAYIQVVLRRPAMPRPVVLVGPLAGQARDRLVGSPDVSFHIDAAISTDAASAASAAVAAAAGACEPPPIVIFVGPRDPQWRGLRKSSLLSAVVALNRLDDSAVLLTSVLGAVRRCQAEPVWMPLCMDQVDNQCSIGYAQSSDYQFNCGLDLPPAHFKEEAEQRLGLSFIETETLANENEVTGEAKDEITNNFVESRTKALLLESRILGRFAAVGGSLSCPVSGSILDVPPCAIRPGEDPVTLQLSVRDDLMYGPLVLVGPTGVAFQRPVKLRGLPIAWSGCSSSEILTDQEGNGVRGGIGALRIFSTPLDATTANEDWTELAWTSDLIDRQSVTFSISMDRFGP